MRKGMSHVEEAVARAASAGNNANTDWLGWKDQERHILRFLTGANDVIVIKVHEYIKGTKGYRNFVCREEFGEYCPICKGEIAGLENTRPRELGYGLAVVRDTIVSEVDGSKKVTGVKDKIVEVEENGETKKRPRVVIISQGPTNFWIILKALYERYGDWPNYDIEIMRQGSDTKTTYIPFQLPAVEIDKFDPNNPLPSEDEVTDENKRYVRFAPDLEGMLKNMGSAKYYDTHLGTKLQGTATSDSGSSASPQSSGGDSFEGELEEQSVLDQLRAAQEAIKSKEGPDGDYD